MQNFNSLKDLMLLEDFKGCLSERVVTYLNEQKVTSLSQAAVLADEFVLTHKSVFISARSDKTLALPSLQNSNPRVKVSPLQSKETRECFYCHKTGHIIADCLTLKQKQQQGQPKPVGFVKTVPVRSDNVQKTDEVDENFKPFVMKGLLSINGRPEDQTEVQILRDTGANQSFVVADVIPLSEQTSCGSSVLIQGIEMGVVKVPLHRVHVQCQLLTGFVKVGVVNSSPLSLKLAICVMFQ